MVHWLLTEIRNKLKIGVFVLWGLHQTESGALCVKYQT